MVDEERSANAHPTTVAVDLKGPSEAPGDMSVALVAPMPTGVDLRLAARRFTAFAAHHGALACGPPLSEPLIEHGVPVQYFGNLVLELGADDRVVPRPLGALALAREHVAPPGGEVGWPPMLNRSDTLPCHATLRYPQRPLAQIRYLVVHHSGAAARVDARDIAAEHVKINGWPGMGYHFVIGPGGLVEQCQDLTVSSHHAAQFNPVAVGIALLGDLRLTRPDPRQLHAAARLLAWLCLQLGLPRQAIRGHGELVATDCPGPDFLHRWKPQLLDLVGVHLRLPTDGSVGGDAG